MLKKKYFNGVPANEITTTSPIGYMSDAQWRALVAKWTDPKNMVCVFMSYNLLSLSLSKGSYFHHVIPSKIFNLL
jgi:hypothetical protein